MTKVKIYLKSGNVLDLEVEELSLQKNALNKITSMTWKGPHILYINLESVEVVIEEK